MTSKASNYGDVSRYVSNRQDFKHGSCSAVTYDGLAPYDMGRLDDEGRIAYKGMADYAARTHQAFYVVYSYATPVAWAVGDYVYHVEQKFSVTTSKQQSYFRVALKGDDFPVVSYFFEGIAT